ncbi:MULTISPECIES: hypothetical protein [Nostocales]|nr:MULTISPECIES: hypothetical protein [Nostocales]
MSSSLAIAVPQQFIYRPKNSETLGTVSNWSIDTRLKNKTSDFIL